MRFLISAFSNQFFRISLQAALLPAVILTAGCSVTRIYPDVPPSPDALSEINSFHVNQVEGVQSALFGKILIHELDQFPQLNYLAIFPEVSKSICLFFFQKIQQKTRVSMCHKIDFFIFP